MNILFVDDEPRVLEGLGRVLTQVASDWSVSCAGSSREALDRLAAAPYDVIVTDLRMPGMDGAQLLDEVRKRHPAVVRLVLSGQADPGVALRAAKVAHQAMVKPCSAEWLTRVVQQTCALQTLISDDKIRAAVGQLDKLPSPPRIFAELTAALEDADTTPDAVAHIVAQDPAISAKLVQLVNSAFFARGKPIHDLRAAVVRLGLRTIRNLALSVEVFADGGALSLPDGQSMDSLQSRALQIAKLAGRIVRPVQAGEAFLAGLLADVGILALAAAAPSVLRRAYAIAKASGSKLYDAERSFRDVTHAEIGGYVLGTWGLPYDIVEAVANHHSPRRIAHEGLGVAASVYIAAAIVEDDTLDTEFVKRIGTAKDIVRWRQIASEIY